MLFKTRFGVHTWGLKDPIDILILDKHKKVVKMKKSLLRNGLFFWNIQFDTVVELPKGSISSSQTQNGDIVEWEG